MNYFVCLLSVIAYAQASNINRLGWSTTTTTTTLPPETPGWPAPTTTTTEAPTTSGWEAPPTEIPTEAPTEAPGWPAPTTLPPPPPPGWGPPPPSSVSTTVLLDGSLAAVGEGVATQSHAENVVVSGDAELNFAAAGETLLYQEGSITQVSQVSPDDALAVNAVDVSQAALADNGVSFQATGQEISNQQIADAAVAGAGAIIADASSNILVVQLR